MNLEKYKYILWDWNGTLLNDVDYCVGCMNQLLSERNMPLLNTKHYQEIFTFPVQDYYEKLGFDFKKESFNIVGHAFMDLYFEQLNTCQLFPVAKQVLSFLRKSEKQQFILSAMEHHSLVSLLQEMEISHFFDGVYGINNHLAAGKIERAKTMIDDHDIDVSKAILIGDTLHDQEVAQTLDCDILLISKGHQSKKKLKTGGAIVVDSLADILKI